MRWTIKRGSKCSLKLESQTSRGYPSPPSFLLLLSLLEQIIFDVGTEVCHLWSQGITSASELSFLGLLSPAQSIPAVSKVHFSPHAPISSYLDMMTRSWLLSPSSNQTRVLHHFFLPVPPCCLPGKLSNNQVPGNNLDSPPKLRTGCSSLHTALRLGIPAHTATILWTVLRSLPPSLLSSLCSGQLQRMYPVCHLLSIFFQCFLCLDHLSPTPSSQMSRLGNFKVTYPPLTHFPQIFFYWSPISSSITQKESISLFIR